MPPHTRIPADPHAAPSEIASATGWPGVHVPTYADAHEHGWPGGHAGPIRLWTGHPRLGSCSGGLSRNLRSVTTRSWTAASGCVSLRSDSGIECFSALTRDMMHAVTILSLIHI